MDDGNLDLANGHRRYRLSIKRFKNNKEKLTEVVEKLSALGFDCTYHLSDGSIWFKTDNTDFISKIICRFVPKSMNYKLPPEYRNKYEDFELENTPTIVKDFVEIKEIRKASDRQMRKRRKFDISVEGNHNYMVGGKYNGVIVHNSPETTTGGEALNFWATGRISVRGPESKARRLVDPVTGDTYGHTTVFEIMKNKLGEPFKKAELNLLYGKGYDHVQELLSLAVSLNLVEKAGSWFKYKDTNLAQGEFGALDKLREDKKLFDELYASVIEMTGLKEAYERHSNPGPLRIEESVSEQTV
jgi:recombination protein RecA